MSSIARHYVYSELSLVLKRILFCELINTFRMWWGYLDLNQGPISYEPTALTTELYPHVLAGLGANRCEYTRFGR